MHVRGLVFVFVRLIVSRLSVIKSNADFDDDIAAVAPAAVGRLLLRNIMTTAWDWDVRGEGEGRVALLELRRNQPSLTNLSYS